MKCGSVSVGVTSTIVLPRADRHRRRLVLCNISDTDITVAQDYNAVLNTGLVIKAGGALDDEVDQKGYMYQGAYSAISAGVAKILTYLVDET